MRKEYEITRSEYLNIDWVANKREEVNRILVEQVSKSDLASMKKVLEQKEQFDQVLQVFMESLEPAMEELANKIFELGTLFEALEQCEEVYNVLLKLQKLEAESFEDQTQYKDRILKILWEKEPILHRDLAAELQMSVSNLSNVMKRMRNMATPLVEENVVGRNKFYQLNRDGRRYILESLGTGDEEENLIYTPPKNYENPEKLCYEINGEYIKFAELFSMAEREKQPEEFYLFYQTGGSQKKNTYLHRKQKRLSKQQKNDTLYRQMNQIKRKESLQSLGGQNEKIIEQDGFFYKGSGKELEDYHVEMHSGRCWRSGL